MFCLIVNGIYCIFTKFQRHAFLYLLGNMIVSVYFGYPKCFAKFRNFTSFDSRNPKSEDFVNMLKFLELTKKIKTYFTLFTESCHCNQKAEILIFNIKLEKPGKRCGSGWIHKILPNPYCMKKMFFLKNIRPLETGKSVFCPRKNLFHGSLL